MASLKNNIKILTGTAPAPGATIGIITPAYPYKEYSDVEQGIAWWESHKFQVKLADGALDRTTYTGGLRESAGTPERRAADLMAMFADPDVHAIQCLRGGDGASEIIPLIDFQVVADNPKPFIGYSNITHLHTAIHRFTGLATFYGPTLTGAKSDLTEARLLSVLSGNTTGVFPCNPTDPDLRVVIPGKGSGRLMGGCLSDLMCTLGTPWEVDLNDAILVIEEIGDSLVALDCHLSQLNLAGKLETLQGVAIGDLLDPDDRPWANVEAMEAILRVRLGHLGVPVVYNLPFGHGEHQATLPLGVHATLDADAGTLVITEAALAPNPDCANEIQN
ncbi:MAG: LD-carboxypeptidase [Verrucomicrobiales bacterium]|nr:LD-carboxypeptidase [Verrucomicrobiales bacterium]